MSMSIHPASACRGQPPACPLPLRILGRPTIRGNLSRRRRDERNRARPHRRDRVLRRVQIAMATRNAWRCGAHRTQVCPARNGRRPAIRPDCHPKSKFLGTPKTQRVIMAKSKRKTSKARVRSSSVKPLLGRTDHVRRSKGKNVSAESSNMATLVAMAQLMADYMAMPMRLAACRSPFELWHLQTRLAHQGLIVMQSIMFGRPLGRPTPGTLAAGNAVTTPLGGQKERRRPCRAASVGAHSRP